MKNKFIKSPAELQKHVDYIIELSDIIDYSENGSIKEEVHLNVDLVLSEPLVITKKQKRDVRDHAKHLTPQGGHIQERYHDQAPTMPRRENLIGHVHYSKSKKMGLVDILYYLFSPITYSSK